MGEGDPLPFISYLNHVSFNCKSVDDSVKFYELLGFKHIRQPSSIPFTGAWLKQYGIGIHLLELGMTVPSEKGKINPTDNHIAFQCSDMKRAKEWLEEKNIYFVPNELVDDRGTVDQLFFHDPDGYMIEFCNCENFPSSNATGGGDPPEGSNP